MKFVCDLCGSYHTNDKYNLSRHHLVCRNRLVDCCLDDSPFSNSSRISDDEVAGDGVNNASSSTNARVGASVFAASTSRVVGSGANANQSLGNSSFTCSLCQRPHGNMASLIAHRKVHTFIPDGLPSSLHDDFGSIHLGRHAFGGRVCDYDLVANEPCPDVDRFFHMSTGLISNLIRDLSRANILQGRMIARARCFKVDDAGIPVEEVFLHFPSFAFDYIDDNGGLEWFATHSARIKELLDTFQSNGSKIVFDCIERLYIKLNLTYNNNGQGTFKLPSKLGKKRQSIINVDSEGQCFKYALLSILHYDDVADSRRTSADSYGQWVGELDFGDIDVNNVSISDISKIEKLNNLKINVHVWEGKFLTIRYNNRRVVAPKTVNVLLIHHNDSRHYCGIISLRRLYYDDKNHNPSDFCERCCRLFSHKFADRTKKALEEHYQYCREGLLQNEALPKDKTYAFSNFAAEESPVLVCYSDIECYIDPETKKHCPAMIGMYEVYHTHFTQKREEAKVRYWQKDDCIQKYLAYLDKLVRELHARSDELSNQPMKISKDEQHAFDAATHCPKCNECFTEETKHKKVRDHCHITGLYRGPLCAKCNWRLRLKRRVLPVFFHNFKGYDGHLICKQAIGEMEGWQLRVIPTTKEKYMSLTARVPVGKTRENRTIFFDIVFLDSFQFLSSSLATLAGTLDHLPITERRMKSLYPAISDSVIRRKGVFPYSYFDSLSRLDETCLPPIEAFKDDITGAECDPEDYAHALRAWSELGCQDFRAYAARYMFLDIYLLADVFEKFRDVSLSEDGLDPVHFVSLPGLSYNACFKRSGETIDLLQDIDMVRLFERGIRGGLTYVNKHHVEARIPELGNNQDGNVHLTYIDQNNLYGSSLCRPLPHSEFSWLNEDELKHFSNPQHILDLEDEGDFGYLFEVDLIYPRELHAITADFPLAPGSGYVEEDMFSPFMKSYYATLCHKRNSNSRYKPHRKLLLTQYDKEQYVCHYAILKYYLAMGMQLVRVHSAIRFRQKRFVEPYIRYNSEKRALARNAFEKDYYKMKNNSFFGKTMEDVRKRIEFLLVTSIEKLDKLISSPLFLDREIFSESVVGVHMFKAKVVLDKPVFIGQAVLDYSKLEMYQLYYNTLRQCPLIRQPELVGGDTDSFFLALHTDKDITLADVLRALGQFFDSSNYPSDHPLYSAANKAKLGCFKDEAAGRVIEEMILLRPKMYSMKFLGGEQSIKRAKGIARHLVSSTSHKAYRDAFLQQSETRYQITAIRSRLHTVETITFRKRGLSAWEDKRCWLDDNSSVPHGSYLSGLPPKRRRVFPVPISGDV